MFKTFCYASVMLGLTQAQELRRHRKQRYAVAEPNTNNSKQRVEDERVQLRQEVAQYWARLLQLSVDVASVEVLSVDTTVPFSIQTIPTFSLATFNVLSISTTAPFEDTVLPTKMPTAPPTKSPTKKPTMMPSVSPTAAPSVEGIVELDLGDDFDVECAGKMAGGKMAALPLSTVAPCGKMGGKMSATSSPVGTVPLEESSGKMGGKMGGKMSSSSSSPVDPEVLDVDDFTVSGKGKSSGKSGGKSSGKSGKGKSSGKGKGFTSAPSLSSSPTSLGGKYGKMNGGKMFLSTTDRTVPLDMEDELSVTNKSYGKMAAGKGQRHRGLMA